MIRHIQMTIDPAAITMRSADKGFIELPYSGDLPGELILRIHAAALKHFSSEFEELENTEQYDYFEGAVRDMTIYLRFKIEREYLWVVALVDLVTTNGEREREKFVLDVSAQNASEVLNQFFDAGAPGFNSEIAAWWYKRFKMCEVRC